AELDAQDETDDLGIAGRAGLHVVRFEVRVVRAQAGGRETRTGGTCDPVGDCTKIVGRPDLEPPRDLIAVAPRQRALNLSIEEEPAAVLMSCRSAHARQPPEKVR